MALGLPITSGALMLNNWINDAEILASSTTPITNYSLSSLQTGTRSDRVLWYDTPSSQINIDIDFGESVRPTAFGIVDYMEGPYNTLYVFNREDAPTLQPVYITGCDTTSFDTNVVSYTVSIQSDGSAVAYLGADRNPGQYATTSTYGAFIVNTDYTVIAVRGSTTAALRTEKLLSNGTLDTSHGTSGVVTTGTISSGSVAIYNGIKSPSVRVFVGKATASDDMCIVKLTSGYALDTSFNSTGYNVFVQEDASKSHYAYAVCQHLSTTFVVAGYSTNSSSLESFAFTKIKADGTIDTTFGTSGHTVVNGFPSERTLRDDRCFGVSSDTTSNKIVGVGYVYNTSNRRVVGVCQLSSAGALDSGFGTGGMTTFDMGHSAPADIAYCVSHVGTSGDFILAGSCRNPETGYSYTGWVAKMTNTGSFSSTFNSGEPLILRNLQIGNGNIGIGTVTDIVVSGSYAYLVSYGTEGGCAAVLVSKIDTTTGKLDTSFGRFAGVGSHLVHSGSLAYDPRICLGSDGSIFATYCVSSSASSTSTIVKFDSNGREDTTWGAGSLSTPKRYWRIQLSETGAGTIPSSVGKVYLGDYVNIRPDLSTVISLSDKSKSDQSWVGCEYADRMKPVVDVSINMTSMTYDEVEAIREYCITNGAHSFGFLNLLGPEDDIDERQDHVFFGNLDERSGFTSSQKSATLWDAKIKFIEEPK